MLLIFYFNLFLRVLGQRPSDTGVNGAGGAN